MRYAGAQLADINGCAKPQNAKTGGKPREMRIEIENPAATNRDRFEHTVAEQKTAIRD